MEDVTRTRPYLVLQILKENTDENHTITIAVILRILKEKYGIASYRETIKKDINLLIHMGCSIDFIKSSQNHYRIAKREFDREEINLLLDAVAACGFITEEKSFALTSKLTSMAGPFESGTLKRNMFLERSAGEDGCICGIMDVINDAINSGRQISFQYFSYNEKKKEVLRHNGLCYVLSPYRLVWNGDFCYVVGFSKEYARITGFRLDRIAGTPEVLEKKSVPLPKKDNLDKAICSSYRIFSTDRKRLQLICDNDAMDYIIDRFGKKTKVCRYDKEHFRADVETDPNNLFYSWVFSLEGKVEIAAPEEVAEAYREMVKEAAGRVLCLDG